MVVLLLHFYVPFPILGSDRNISLLIRLPIGSVVHPDSCQIGTECFTPAVETSIA